MKYDKLKPVKTLRIVIRAEREQDRTFTDDSEWLFKNLGAVFVCFM